MAVKLPLKLVKSTVRNMNIFKYHCLICFFKELHTVSQLESNLIQGVCM